MTDRKEISRLESERAEDRSLIRSLNARIIELAQAANAARDEAEALRNDAERYRHLRSIGIVIDGHDFISFHEIADYRIDVAMGKDGGR
jgi:tRNA splicing endonuclease